MKSHNYFVYILTNKNKTVLYTGVTNNIERRLYEHQNALNPGFTKRYNCHYLVYFEYFQDINMAISREKEIKGWKREKKNALVESKNSEWKFLNGMSF